METLGASKCNQNKHNNSSSLVSWWDHQNPWKSTQSVVGMFLISGRPGAFCLFHILPSVCLKKREGSVRCHIKGTVSVIGWSLGCNGHNRGRDWRFLLRTNENMLTSDLWWPTHFPVIWDQWTWEIMGHEIQDGCCFMSLPIRGGCARLNILPSDLCFLKLCQEGNASQ